MGLSLRSPDWIQATVLTAPRRNPPVSWLGWRASGAVRVTACANYRRGVGCGCVKRYRITVDTERGSMAGTTWQVLTVGYSTRTITEFVELLRVADRDLVQQSSNTKAASGSNAGRFLTTGLPLPEHGHVRQATAWEGRHLEIGRRTGNQMLYPLARRDGGPKARAS